MPEVSVVVLATSRSNMRWRLSQKSGVIRKAFPRRSAVSAVMERRHTDSYGEAVLTNSQFVDDFG